MVKLFNPLAFNPISVTAITTIIYLALIVPLIVIHTTIPASPSEVPIKGINITEAWRDLQLLTKLFHPHNSKENDRNRNYVLKRIDQILQGNGALTSYPHTIEHSFVQEYSNSTTDTKVYVFNDLESNLTVSSPPGPSRYSGRSEYFEGSNIIVYVRGTEDDTSEWWKQHNGKPRGKGGVLVNSHIDSVSLAFGATDDGIGVVTGLQLIEYFTTAGQTPRKGLVVLFNNNEEANLFGARAYSQHPISRFPHTFINVDSAGGHGRAILYRATDVEVVYPFRKAPRPLSDVVASDSFVAGGVASQTDFLVFAHELGLRGTDNAFFYPRAVYHTDEDDTRHTGKDSLWHMLSGILAATKALTADTSNTFEGESKVQGKVGVGDGSAGVWFGLFDRALVVFQLHTLFAISVTLLVVSPVILILTSALLYKYDKFYLFSGSRLYHSPQGDQEIRIYGWRGFFRYPLIFLISSAVPVALSYLVAKQNPLIILSSEWAVWAMMFSAWFFVAWFLCCAAYFTRPTAFSRAYANIWLFGLFWAILVADTVLETQFKIGGGYFLVFYFASISLVTWISFLEMSALPRKSEYCHSKMDPLNGETRIDAEPDSSALDPNITHESDRNDGEDGGENVTESTSLLRSGKRSAFANYTRTEDATDPVQGANHSMTRDTIPYHDEQDWSASLPSWTWLLQLILFAPLAVILCFQVALILVFGTHQNAVDGSSILLPYLLEAAFTVLILLPVLPILHRFTYHIPIFLLFVVAGTLIYNLTAFPFSNNNRFRVFFQQNLDLDTGINTVNAVGLRPWILETVSRLPSSAGQEVECRPLQALSTNDSGLQRCVWAGLSPRIGQSNHDGVLPQQTYKTWVHFNVTSPSPETPSRPNSARIELGGKNTRECGIDFDIPIRRYHVLGSAPDNRYWPSIQPGGTKVVRLISRSWDRNFTVDFEWEDQAHEGDTADAANVRSGITGSVSCFWDDVNTIGVMPAVDEIRHFAPRWVAISPLKPDGLLVGSKRFTI